MLFSEIGMIREKGRTKMKKGGEKSGQGHCNKLFLLAVVHSIGAEIRR